VTIKKVVLYFKRWAVGIVVDIVFGITLKENITLKVKQFIALIENVKE